MISHEKYTRFWENQRSVLTHVSQGAARPTSHGSSLAMATFEQSHHVSGKQTEILILRTTCIDV